MLCLSLATRWSTTRHRKSTCITQLTLGPYAVQSWSRNALESGPKETRVLRTVVYALGLFSRVKVIARGQRGAACARWYLQMDTLACIWVRISSFGFRVSVFGVRFSVFSLMIFSLRVWGLGFGVSGFGLRVSIFRFPVQPRTPKALSPRHPPLCPLPRGTSAIRNRPPLEPRGRPVPRALWRS